MAFFIEIMQLSKSKIVNNALNKINVHSYLDVLLYLPYKYDDLSLTKENNLKGLFVKEILQEIEKGEIDKSTLENVLEIGLDILEK